MKIDQFDEAWAIRRALRRVVLPGDAHFWAYVLAILFTIGITFLMVFFVLLRIRGEMCILPSLK